MGESSVFEILHSAWRNGTPVVPLFGAGLSRDADIPTTPGLVDYLAKLQAHGERVRKEPIDNGQPSTMVDAHEVNEELLYARAEANQKERSSDSLQEVVLEVLKSEVARRFPSVASHLGERADLYAELTSWRDLLTAYTQGAPSKVDQFFDRIIREKSPASSHRFVAFLTQLLGWRLVLTTNFDPLIEEALREHGLRPTVYELTESGPVPDAILVRENLSVVKLHGGAFALRVGEDLDRPMQPSDLERFRAYLPAHAILLVLGYGGGDARVMSLLHDFLQKDNRDDSAESPRLIWVFRDNPPPVLEKMRESLKGSDSSVRAVRYRDAARFLQELYFHLASCHPASETPYTSIPETPRPLPREVSPEISAHSGEPELRVYVCSEEARGTSVSLSSFAHSLRDTHRVLWVDLEELPTFMSFVATALELFRKLDSGLSPVVFASDWSSRIASLRGEEAEVYSNHFVRALQRGRYILAVDSLGEFPSDLLPSERRDGEFKKIVSFFEHLKRRVRDFGESVVALSCSGSFVRFETKELLGGAKPDGEVYEARHSWPSGGDTVVTKAVRIPKMKEAKKKYLDEYERLKTEDEDASKLIGIASVMRRPRSLVALRNLFRELVKSKGVERDSQALDKILNKLQAKSLLYHNEGGFYSMHRWIREVALQEVSEKPAVLATINNIVARHYYDQVFLPSRDLRAFFEYVHHRIASTKGVVVPNEAKGSGIDTVTRHLRSLLHAIQRERDYLLSQGHSDILLTMIDSIREKELPRCERDIKKWKQQNGDAHERLSEFASLRADLLATLCELKATVLRELTDFEGCIELRVNQISDRIDTTGGRLDPPTGWESPLREGFVTPELKDWLLRVGNRKNKSDVANCMRALEHILDIGVCLKGQGLFDAADKTIRGISDLLEKLPDSRRAHIIELRCMYRRADTILSRIHPWLADVSNDQSAQYHDELAEVLQLGAEAVERYTGGDEFLRFRCYFNTMSAKSQYLIHPQKGFSVPYQLLDTAKSALYRSVGASDRTAVGVCYLHHAECTIKHADRRMLKTNKENRFEIASGILSRTRLHLDKARGLLSEGHRNLWWWAWLHELDAQLVHEIALLELERRTGSHGDRNPVPWMQGLNSIRLGLDIVGKGFQRRRNLLGLWKQLCFLYFLFPFLLVRNISDDDVSHEWRRLNVRCGLKDVLDSESAVIEDVIEARDNAVTEDVSIRDPILKAEMALLDRSMKEEGIK